MAAIPLRPLGGGLRTLECSHRHLAHAEVSKLADRAGVCLFLDDSVLLLQGLLLDVVLVSVLHPLQTININSGNNNEG